MSPERSVEQRPASRRPFSFRDHAPFALLMAVAVPLMLAFVWHDGLASMGDDSITYLTLARYFAPGPSWADNWAWQHAHFPPLFSLALLMSGGATDLVVAHLLVAAFAALALLFLYAYASRRLASPIAAALLVALFLLTPTAWISIQGILSESLYLLLSLAALWLHATRLEAPGAAARHWLLFGVLLAGVFLTRSAGITLIAAYAVQAAIRALSTRGRGVSVLLLPAVPVVALTLAWIVLRPDGGSGFRSDVVFIVARWIDQGSALLPYASGLFHGGWIASFQADTATGRLPDASFLVLLGLGVAGAAWQASRNRLDGWYVVLSVALVFAWTYSQDTARRLLYPIVPLLILHAAELVLLMARRLAPARRAMVLGCAALVLAVLCLPATVLLFEKARMREPVAGTRYSYSHITNYYLHVNEALARQIAGAHLATFAGFDALAAATPASARVMWVRPEYVALLAHREAIPYLNEWDSLALAREIQRSNTGYVIFAEMYKVDLNTTMRHPREVLVDVPSYSREVIAIANPVSRLREFAVYEIDRPRLVEFIESRESSRADR